MKNPRSKRAILAEWFALQAFRMRMRTYSKRMNNIQFYWIVRQNSRNPSITIYSQNEQKKKNGTFFQWGTHPLTSLTAKNSHIRQILSQRIGEKPTRKLIKQIRRTSRRNRFMQPLYRIAEITFMGISRSLSKSERSRG